MVKLDGMETQLTYFVCVFEGGCIPACTCLDGCDLDFSILLLSGENLISPSCLFIKPNIAELTHIGLHSFQSPVVHVCAYFSYTYLCI